MVEKIAPQLGVLNFARPDFPHYPPPPPCIIQASNAIHCAMLYDDVLLESAALPDALAMMYKHGPDYYADVCFEAPDAVFYAHKCILIARAPAFWSAVQARAAPEDDEGSGGEDGPAAVRMTFVSLSFEPAAALDTAFESPVVFETFLQVCSVCMPLCVAHGNMTAISNVYVVIRVIFFRSECVQRKNRHTV